MYIYMYLYIYVCVCTHTREPIWIATSRLEFTNLTESLKDLKLNIARTHKKIQADVVQLGFAYRNVYRYFNVAMEMCFFNG